MAAPNNDRNPAPVVPASVWLPEITVKGVVLSVILAAVLAGANAYLGLFAGMTVSASIPAAVASMAILQFFRRSNILENNIVQTAASSGEALAAGVIFTIPALLLIGAWTNFHYWQTTAIALVGGLLGVLFTIPLRRALIVTERLRFPEGVATAEVLKVGSATKQGEQPGANPGAAAGFQTLLTAGLLGGAVKFGESALRLWTEAMEGAVSAGRSVLYAGINLSPALLAVGYIIGLKTAVVVFLGGALGWLVLMPLYGAIVGVPEDTTSIAAAKALWSNHIRYVGIGAMLVGGLWTLAQLRRPIAKRLKSLRIVYADTIITAAIVPRTEQDAPFSWLATSLIASLVLIAGLYYGMIRDGPVAIAMTVMMVMAAFLFSAVAAYMAGLVGSSSNPVSGVTIATIMLTSLLLVLIMGRSHPAGPAAALLIGAVVCCAAAMGGDNLQDLKTGHLLGATPWKQQIMQVVGVVTAAVVIVPVLTLLQTKYGIGDATADHPHPLSAPQATLMASLTRGVFGGGLPWHLVGIGMAIGIGVILWDRKLEAGGSTFRVPVLSVALGIYLPLKLSAAIVAGGVIAEMAQRAANLPDQQPSGRGVLFAAGLVTGEALMGIILAIPVALSGIWPSLSADPFKLFEQPPYGAWPGVAALAVTAYLLYRSATTSVQVQAKVKAEGRS